MEHYTARTNYGEATEGCAASLPSPNHSRKRGRSSTQNDNGCGSSNDYVHSKSSRRSNNNDTARGSVDSLVSSRKQKRNQVNDGLDLVDSNNNSAKRNVNNNTNNINNISNNNDNNNNNNKTVINTPQQHQKSISTISDNCQLKSPTKKCNGISDENVTNCTDCDTALLPLSPKRSKKKNTTPFSPVKTRSGCTNDAGTSQSRRNIPLWVDNNASSSTIQMDAATLQSFIELLCSDYIINTNQQLSLETLYSLTPDNSLYDIEMCKVMQEALHDLERIRNGEIKGEEEILRVWNKYRDRIAAAYPEEYKDLINQGTAPNPNARSMTLQNFATKNALTLQSLEDLDNYNLVLGACPRLLEQTFPRIIAHDITGHGGHDISLVKSGLTYQQDVVSIAFNALCAADEVSRDTHHDNNMDDFGTAVGEEFDKYMVAAINTINIIFGGELCYSVHGEPMLLLLGTPKAEQYMFDSGLIGTDGRITRRLNIVGPAIPHSQRWWDDFIKSNCGDDEKAQICAIIWRFYLPLLQKLGIGQEESITNVRTQIAFNWGKKMTKEEIKAKQESRREMNQRKRDAWAAVKAGTSNDTQDKYVKRTGFYKMMLGWRKYKEDPLTVPLNLQLYLVKGIAWKLHKAKILGMGEEGAELAAQIASIEASANAEMERRKIEKERIEAERKRVRLENINKELESIKKIPVTRRTDMHTIRCNFLNALLNGTRREQVYWREKHTAEKKTLKAEKAAERRVEIESKIKSLSTINRTTEEEFQFNLLNAQLRGDKNKVKRLKIEKELKSIPDNRTELQQIRFDLLNAQLQGDKNKVKRLRIEEKARRDNKAEANRLKIERIKLIQEQQEQIDKKRLKSEKKEQKEKEFLTQKQKQAQMRYDWYEQSYKPKQQQQLQQQQLIQQQQQQLVYQQNLLHYEEQQLNLSIEQQHRNIHKEEQHSNMKEEERSGLLHSQQQLHYQKERLFQIQQQKQQNMMIFMQLQSQQQQYLSQQQYLTQTTQTSSQAKKPNRKQRKPFNYTKVMEILPEQLNPATAYEFVEKAYEMFEEDCDNSCNRWNVFKKKLNPQQLSLIEEARTLLMRKRRGYSD